MSDTMFYGVLRMPYALAMSNDMSRIQFYDRAQDAADRVEAAEKRVAELEEMVCKLAAAAPVAPAHDREADRQRFPDPDFNRWLDESVSDYHTVWDVVQDIAAAWAGWDNRQFYAAPVAAQEPAWTPEQVAQVHREADAMRAKFRPGRVADAPVAIDGAPQGAGQ